MTKTLFAAPWNNSVTNLSPAAKAIRDAAYFNAPGDLSHTLEARIAAALRAAAAIPSASAPVPFAYKLSALATELENSV